MTIVCRKASSDLIDLFCFLAFVLFFLQPVITYGQKTGLNSSDMLFENDYVTISLEYGTLINDPNTTWRWGEYYEVSLSIFDKKSKKTLRISDLQQFTNNSLGELRPILFRDPVFTDGKRVNFSDFDTDGVIDGTLIFDANSQDLRKELIIFSLRASGPVLAFKDRFFFRDPGDGDFSMKTLRVLKKVGGTELVITHTWGGTGTQIYKKNNNSGRYGE